MIGSFVGKSASEILPDLPEDPDSPQPHQSNAATHKAIDAFFRTAASALKQKPKP